METKSTKKTPTKDIFADYNIAAITGEIMSNGNMKSDTFEAMILVLNVVLKSKPVYTKEEILLAMDAIINSMPENYEAGLQIAKIGDASYYSFKKNELYNLFNKFLCTWLVKSNPAFIKNYADLKKGLEEGLLFKFFSNQNLKKENEEAFRHAMLSQILLLCNELNTKVGMDIWYSASSFMQKEVFLAEIFRNAHTKITEIRFARIKEFCGRDALWAYMTLVKENFLEFGYFVTEGEFTKGNFLEYMSLARQEALDYIGKKEIGRLIPIRMNLLKLEEDNSFLNEALIIIEQRILDAFKVGNQFPVTDKGKLDKISKELASMPIMTSLRRDKKEGPLLK